jgi:hypothetical protein
MRPILRAVNPSHCNPEGRTHSAHAVRRNRPLHAWLCAALCLAVAGCNAFDARPAEDGEATGEAFPDPTTGIAFGTPSSGGFNTTPVTPPRNAGTAPGAPAPGPGCPATPMWQEPCEQPGQFCSYGETCGVQSCQCEADEGADDDAGATTDEDAGAPAPDTRWECIVTLC